MRVISAAETAPSASAADSPRAERSTLRLDAGPATLQPVQPAPSREVLERELDRIQGTLLHEQANFGRQLAWQMLSQGLLFNAYLTVLIVGWSTPLPAKRWLLAALAIFATVVAALIYLAQRGSQEASLALRAQRRDLEARLLREHGRKTVFAPGSVVTRGLAAISTALLPLSFIVGWALLTIYTLAAPIHGQDAAPGNAAVAAPTRTGPVPPTRRPPLAPSPAVVEAQDTAPAPEEPGAQAPPRPRGLQVVNAFGRSPLGQPARPSSACACA